MKKILQAAALAVTLFLLPPVYGAAQQPETVVRLVRDRYDLLPSRSRDTQYYQMESRLQTHAPDGAVKQTNVYRLHLRCVPGPAGKDQYTCLRFTVQVNNDTPRAIPLLSGWTYPFPLSPAEGRGYVLGIDHAPFEKLVDETGKPLAVDHAYHVYNAFIDFHSMSVFADKTDSGRGVQDLQHIGDKVVHAAAFSQPAVNLGSQVAEGSYFRNGKITLEFKGVGVVNGKASALLGYDSGESSFYMKVRPMPNVEVTTRGSSHYWGDIYKDLSGGWIQKAILNEMVVSETEVPGMKNKIPSVIERAITIQNVARPALQ